MRQLLKAAAMLCLVGSIPAWAEKTVIKSEADLPRVTIELGAKPSELVFNGGPAFEALVDDLEAYAADMRENYIIEDAATQKSLYSLYRMLAMEAGEWDEALSYTPKIQELEDKDAARELVGVTSDPFAIALKEVGSLEADGFEAAFAKALNARLAEVDVDVVRDSLQAMQGQMRIISQELLIGSIEGQLDQVAAQMENVVTPAIASGIVGARRTFLTLPKTKDIILAEVTEVLEQEPEAEKPDLWAARSVTVEDGAEVVAAVWDTGVDAALQGDRMWVNPNADGYAHGIAFDEDFNEEPADLLPKADQYADELDDMLGLLKGIQDLQAGLNSEEAANAQTHMAGLKRDQVMDFQTRMGVLGNYIHGQHVADITADDLASVKLMNIRMSWPTDPVPTEPLDEQWAQGLVASAKKATALMQENGVRVANMSWRMTRPAIEGLLQVTGTETDPEKAKARAAEIFEIMRSGLEEAFAQAPDVLFIAGAGNEDEDVEFVQSVPAGINLPNVITIGAVDQALQPASFTSYGKSIDLYANGFEVEGRVPGGRVLKLSGTSMAAPQVANVAAKMFAVNPELTVEDAVQILTQTATKEGDQGLMVVHPAYAVQAAKELKTAQAGR